MAKSSGMSDVLVLGAVGVGVYLAWPTIVGFLTGVTTSLNAAGLPASTPVPTPAPTPRPHLRQRVLSLASSVLMAHCLRKPAQDRIVPWDRGELVRSRLLIRVRRLIRESWRHCKRWPRPARTQRS